MKKSEKKEVVNKSLENQITKNSSEIKKENLSHHDLKVLTILVIILLVIDFSAYFIYYKPEINFDFIKNIKLPQIDSTSKNSINTNNKETSTNTKKCNDGTSYNNCSKDKPKYCYEGELLNKASLCGCPKDYKVSFQDCVKV
jgi:hypothetical protein